MSKSDYCYKKNDYADLVLGDILYSQIFLSPACGSPILYIVEGQVNLCIGLWHAYGQKQKLTWVENAISILSECEYNATGNIVPPQPFKQK